MGLLFKFGQAVQVIFKFLLLENRGFVDCLVEIYEWILKV